MPLSQLPTLRTLLYVRVKDVPQLAKHYPWTFRTKLQLAAELVRWLTVWLAGPDHKLWLAVDGAYAKRPFLKPVLAVGVTVFSRLRKDAHLLSPPPSQRRRGQRGPSPRYGKERIDLAKRAGQKRGWQRLECWQYGERVVKKVKTFLATWRPAGGKPCARNSAANSETRDYFFRHTCPIPITARRWSRSNRSNRWRMSL